MAHENSTLTGEITHYLAGYVAPIMFALVSLYSMFVKGNIYTNLYFFGARFPIPALEVLAYSSSFFIHYAALPYLYPHARTIVALSFVTIYANVKLFVVSSTSITPMIFVFVITLLLRRMDTNFGFFSMRTEDYYISAFISIILSVILVALRISVNLAFFQYRFLTLSTYACSYMLFYFAINKYRHKAPLRLDSVKLL